MTKKKIIIDILVIIVAFALFVVWYENSQKDIPTTSSPQNYLVYLITMDKNLQFPFIINEGASDMAELLGVTYIWDAPKERNVDEQINIINNAVKAGADAIMIATIDPIKVSPAIKEAKAQGIKIIYVDAPAAEEGIVTVATDNYNAGVTAGVTMLSELAAAGVRNGSIGILGVTPETSTTIDREKGFRNAISSDGKFQLLETNFTYENIEKAEMVSTSLINENPDLVGLFGSNETTTTGMGIAIEKSQKPIIGIGFDLTDTIQKMINNGSLKAVMVQNPYTMGYLGLAEAFAALKGYNTGPTFIDTGVSVRTQYSY